MVRKDGSNIFMKKSWDVNEFVKKRWDRVSKRLIFEKITFQEIVDNKDRRGKICLEKMSP